MEKNFFITAFFMLFSCASFAQYNVGTSTTSKTDIFGNTVTTHKDRYGNVTGTSTTGKTDMFGNTVTVHKDRYGNKIGTSTTGQTDIFGNTTTVNRDRYGNKIGTSTTGQTDYFGNTTTVNRDRYGNKTGSSTTGQTDIFGNTTTVYKDRYGNNRGKSTTGKTDIFGNTTTKHDGNTTTTNSWAAGVPTVFHHMLAQIVAINFQTVENASGNPVVVKDYANGHDGTSEHKYVAGDKQFVVTDVYFEKFFEQGTLSAGDAWSWASTGSVTDSYTWYSNTSDPAKFIGGQCTPRNTYYLVLPQTHSNDAMLHVKYEIHTYTSASEHATEKMDVSVLLKNLNAKWEMNKKYTYTLNIDLDRIYWDPKVTEWTTDSTGSAEI